MAQLFYLPIVLLAAVVGMAVAFFAWIHGDRPGARPLTLLVTAASFWTVAEGLSVATAGLGSFRFWTNIAFTLSAVAPIAWLATVLAYTGRDHWLTRKRLAGLLVWPAVFVCLVWSTTSHGLVWTAGGRTFIGAYGVFAIKFGVAFWAHQVYTYLLVTAGAFLLVRMMFRTDRLYRSQSVALLVAITVPMVGNALYIFGVLPPGLDPSGVGYVLTSLVIAGVMFRAQMLQIAPAVRELGREEVLTELDDAVVILDENDRVVDANPAAEGLLDADPTDYLGHPLSDRLPTLAAALDSGDSPIRLDTDGRVRYYDVQASRLYRGYGALSGRLVSLRDITDQRRREQRLDVLNRVLRHNIRNELNVVRGNIELVRSKTTGDDSVDRLDTAIDTVDTIIDRSDKVGRLSRLFESETDGHIDLADHLESDLVTMTRTYPEAEVHFRVPETLEVAVGPSITVVFEELVTNAIEHNDSDHPHVEISVDERASDDQFVVVTIVDNGPGIDEQERRVIEAGRETPLEHGSGVGLWLVNWVLERHGGTLSFENIEDGCRVSVRLPRAEGPDPSADTAAIGGEDTETSRSATRPEED